MNRPFSEPPRHREGVTFQALPDGTGVLVDGTSGNVYAVNATAGDVWTLCDGRRTLEEIVDALLERYDAPRADVVQATAAWLVHLRQLGVLDL